MEVADGVCVIEVDCSAERCTWGRFEGGLSKDFGVSARFVDTLSAIGLLSPMLSSTARCAVDISSECDVLGASGAALLAARCTLANESAVGVAENVSIVDRPANSAEVGSADRADAFGADCSIDSTDVASCAGFEAGGTAGVRWAAGWVGRLRRGRTNSIDESDARSDWTRDATFLTALSVSGRRCKSGDSAGSATTPSVSAPPAWMAGVSPNAVSSETALLGAVRSAELPPVSADEAEDDSCPGAFCIFGGATDGAVGAGGAGAGPNGEGVSRWTLPPGI